MPTAAFWASGLSATRTVATLALLQPQRRPDIFLRTSHLTKPKCCGHRAAVLPLTAGSTRSTVFRHFLSVTLGKEAAWAKASARTVTRTLGSLLVTRILARL